jgi:hypothetical protein
MTNVNISFLDTNTELVRQTKKNVSLEASSKFRHSLYNTREIGKTILTKNEFENLDKKPRHSFCGFATHERHVKIVKANSDKYMYNGVASCAAIWRCPICSMKILKGRAKELYSITSQHLKASDKNQIGFLTLTIRHNKKDSLKTSLNKLVSSWRKLQNQRFFSDIKKGSCYLGQIKALEITHTKNNGWHPHFHILLFWENLSAEQINQNQNLILKSWVKLTKGSLDAQDQKIVFNNDILDYVTKWDSIQELTNDFKKSSSGVKPFQLLSYIYDNKLLYEYKNLKSSNKRCKAMFSEYIEATKGRHRIGISRNLNTLYKIEIKTDEQLTNEINIEDIILSFERQVWQTINLNDLQPYLIDIVYQEANKVEQKTNCKIRSTELILQLLNEFDQFTEIEVNTNNIKHSLIKKVRV